MKRLTWKSFAVAIIGAFGMFAVPAYAAQSVTINNTPLPVTVQGQTTPVPVSVTNAIVPVKVINDPTNGGSASVNVTNSATNPVKTSVDQYPRTPVRSSADFYTVPDGSRLILETVSMDVTCNSATALASALVGIGPLGHPSQAIRVVVQLVESAGGFNTFAGTETLRVVIGAGETATVLGNCNGVEPGAGAVHGLLSGYLISVNSPSLAP